MKFRKISPAFAVALNNTNNKCLEQFAKICYLCQYYGLIQE